MLCVCVCVRKMLLDLAGVQGDEVSVEGLMLAGVGGPGRRAGLAGGGRAAACFVYIAVWPLLLNVGFWSHHR